jgi:hypothetical protein
MTPKATARAEKVVERAGVTASERLDAARRKRIAAAAARKRESDAYWREFSAKNTKTAEQVFAEQAAANEQPPPTMAPYVP